MWWWAGSRKVADVSQGKEPPTSLGTQGHTLPVGGA